MLSPDQQLEIMINQLHELETCKSLPDNAHAVLSEHPKEPELVARIRCKARKLLLENRVPNEQRIAIVNQAGFQVCSEHEDLFGWSSGAVFTRKGRIVF